MDLELEPSGTLDLATRPVGHLSLSVDKLKSGNRMEDRELQKRIEAQKFPKIEGVLDKMVSEDTDGSLPGQRGHQVPRRVPSPRGPHGDRRG